MADRYELRRGTAAPAAGAAVDAGLRSYMLGVYNYMASGVLLTGLVAMLTASSPAMLNAIFGTPLQWVVMLAPLGFVLVMSFGINRLSPFAAQALFWAFAATMGLSLASIFLVYTGSSIARTFFITAAMFGALSLYGYTTKRDLSGMGTFLFMGLIGLIIAMVVNMFLQSTQLDWIVSIVGVGIFAGLTAYDTQKIREMYFAGDGEGTRSKKIVMGALSLYLDFINMFLFLLRFLGNRE